MKTAPANPRPRTVSLDDLRIGSPYRVWLTDGDVYDLDYRGLKADMRVAFSFGRVFPCELDFRVDEIAKIQEFPS